MLSISRNARLSVCLSVLLFTFEVPFKRLFAPTSQSQMSNIFRDSESLGKSNGKKWSQIWTFLFRCGLKSAKNNNFFGLFCLTKQGGNHASRWITDLWYKGKLLIFAYFWTFLSFCVLHEIFLFFKQFGFWGILGPPGKTLPDGLGTFGRRVYC